MIGWASRRGGGISTIVRRGAYEAHSAHVNLSFVFEIVHIQEEGAHVHPVVLRQDSSGELIDVQPIVSLMETMRPVEEEA